METGALWHAGLSLDKFSNHCDYYSPVGRVPTSTKRHSISAETVVRSNTFQLFTSLSPLDLFGRKLWEDTHHVMWHSCYMFALNSAVGSLTSFLIFSDVPALCGTPAALWAVVGAVAALWAFAGGSSAGGLGRFCSCMVECRLSFFEGI